jgi:hypothetical protein
MLFIHLDTVESKFGTSYYNMDEARAVKEIVEYLIFAKGFDKDRFGFISGYNG